KTSLARPPAIPPSPLPSSLVPSTSSQPAHRSPSQRLPACFHSLGGDPVPAPDPHPFSPPGSRISCVLNSSRLALHQARNHPARKAAGEFENDPKIVEVDSGGSWAPFYIDRPKTPVLEESTETSETKSGLWPRASIGELNQNTNSAFEIGLCCDLPGYNLRPFFIRAGPSS